MEYKIRRSSSAGTDDEILGFPNREAAERMIQEELDDVKDALDNYDYGEFFYEDGLATEIWVPNDDFYTSWTRLWTNQMRF